jgi:hypothetical protein
MNTENPAGTLNTVQALFPAAIIGLDERDKVDV